MSNGRWAASASVFVALFIVGFCLMGFEMLGSRYLNPYFGGGITTWASLISVVLLAMMIGYFIGGRLIDANPSIELFCLAIVLAGINIAIVPSFADPMLAAFLDSLGYGLTGVLTGAFALSFLPVALLSACSPIVVRLHLVDLATGGKTTGLVYAVSTLGNVFGTLFTTFYLIPGYGTRTITIAFGVVLVVVGVLLYALKNRLVLAYGAMLAIAVLPPPRAEAAGATADPVREISASYPEGPLWDGGRLLYTEMGRDRVMTWKDTVPTVFWQEQKCGPTAIARFGRSGFLVLCHQGKKLVEVSATGETLRAFASASDGTPLQDPNDATSDGNGGAFFTDPGTFQKGAAATGRVYHISSEGKVSKLVDGLRYANGIAYDPESRRLLVSEHLGQRVLEYPVNDDLSLGAPKTFLDVARHVTSAYPETGPDGIEFDADGNVYVAVYGAGMLLIVSPDGSVREHVVDTPFVTNVAIAGDTAAVVGAYINDMPPYPGKVAILPRRGLAAAHAN
jgi:sugar lactone lactonase YvrE